MYDIYMAAIYYLYIVIFIFLLVDPKMQNSLLLFLQLLNFTLVTERKEL